MHRFLRSMICLMLICAVLVNISPIRAEASAVGAATAIAATVAVGSIFYGLGIRYAQDYDFYVDGVEYWSDFLSSTTDFITSAGMATVVSLGSGRYGVSSAFVQACRDLIWDYAILVEKSPFAENITEYMIGNATVELSSTVPSAVFVTVGDWQEINSETLYTVNVATCEGEFPCPYFGVTGNLNFIASYYGSDYSVTVGDTYHRIRGIGVRGYIGPYYTYSDSEDLESLAASLISDSTEVVPMDGLAVDFAAKPSLSLAEGYPEWAANSVVIDDETYYPIAVVPSIEELKDVTQADVWAGNGTITDTNTGTGSGTVTVPDNATLKDILAGVLTLPQAIAQAVSGFFANVVSAVQAIPAVIQAIPAAIADIFTPSADVGHFSISLSDYFPFCIPFDIYDFLTCLNADPVAPVIEWVIFERDGTGHPITVDLSPFDSVARILRTLQLLLFCVGLATKTRDLIKG